MNKQSKQRLIRNLVIELVGYGMLVVAYATFVVPWLEKPLADLFDRNLSTYALVGMGVIVIQGLLLDVVTTFLVNQLRLDQRE